MRLGVLAVVNRLIRIGIAVLPFIAIFYLFCILNYKLSPVAIIFIVILWYGISIYYFRNEKQRKQEKALFIYSLFFELIFLILIISTTLIYFGWRN